MALYARHWQWEHVWCRMFISSGLANWADTCWCSAHCLPTRTPKKVMKTFAKCTLWAEIWWMCKAKFLFPLLFPLELVSFRLFCRNAETLVTVFFSLLLYCKMSILYQFSEAEMVMPHFKLFKLPSVPMVIFSHSYWITRQYFLLLQFRFVLRLDDKIFA